MLHLCNLHLFTQACYTSEDRAAGHELPVVATPLSTWDACGALQRIVPSILPSSDAKIRRCKARPLPATRIPCPPPGLWQPEPSIQDWLLQPYKSPHHDWHTHMLAPGSWTCRKARL